MTDSEVDGVGRYVYRCAAECFGAKVLDAADSFAGQVYGGPGCGIRSAGGQFYFCAVGYDVVGSAFSEAPYEVFSGGRGGRGYGGEFGSGKYRALCVGAV